MQTAPPDNDASLKEDNGVVSLGGRLDAQGTAKLWNDARRIGEKGNVRVDAKDVTYCDGTGVALLFELIRKDGGQVENLDPKFEQLLDQFSPKDFDKKGEKKKRMSNVEIIGRWGVDFATDLYEQVQFLGRIVTVCVSAIWSPRSIRWRDMWVVLEKAGVNAVGLVGMIGFLMGLIMAFSSAMPLKDFGADIFVVNLVALAIFRELGPIMTAIVLSGRSGSAFAAEIGTMKVNEELNALKTMGLDDARFLVAPRVLAGIIATPVLTVYANLMGVAGGFFVMMAMGYPFQALYRQMISAVGIHDFMSGLVKACVFGILVAGIGCLRGLQTKSGATAVGDSTTRAVVSGIVLIVLSDAIFAVLFYALDF